MQKHTGQIGASLAGIMLVKLRDKGLLKVLYMACETLW